MIRISKTVEFASETSAESAERENYMPNAGNADANTHPRNANGATPANFVAAGSDIFDVANANAAKTTAGPRSQNAPQRAEAGNAADFWDEV